MPQGCGSSSRYVISKPVMSSTLKSSMSVCEHHGSRQRTYTKQQYQCITGPLQRVSPSGDASNCCALESASCSNAAGRGLGQQDHQDCCRKIEKRHLEVVGVGIRIDVLAPDAAARALQAGQIIDWYMSPTSTPTLPFEEPRLRIWMHSIKLLLMLLPDDRAGGQSHGRPERSCTCWTTLLFLFRSSLLKLSYSSSVTIGFPAWYANVASINFCSTVLHSNRVLKHYGSPPSSC